MNDQETAVLIRLLNLEHNTDSIEIGTPSKGGAIKVYGDFSKPAEFLAKIENAKHVRDQANALLGGVVA